MTPERWQKVKEILYEAMQKEPGKRAAYLGQTCQTDPSLRDEVDSLLGSSPDALEAFLKSAPPEAEWFSTGTRLGAYEIVHLLGIGGMGEVYRAHDYDRKLRDILSIENEVSQSIADAIRLKLSAEEKAHLAAARPVVPEAHEAYLKGRFLWNQRSEPDLRKAINFFQEAIAKDPTYAPAYAGLADTYFYLGYAWGHMRPTDAMPLARSAAEKAIELDPGSAEGHASLAAVELTYDWNLPGAEQEVRRSIAINPNNEWAHHVYSVLLMTARRPDESIAEARKAVQVDPLSVPARNILALLLVAAGRYDESIQEDLKTLEIDPNPVHLGGIHSRLQDNYERKGMHKEAFEEHVKTLQAYGLDAKVIDEHRKIFAEKGWRGLKENDLKSALSAWEKEHWHFNAYIIASMYARLGDKDQAFAWLNKCLELRSTMLYLIDAAPELAPFRSDARYAELKRKMGISSGVAVNHRTQTQDQP